MKIKQKKPLSFVREDKFSQKMKEYDEAKTQLNSRYLNEDKAFISKELLINAGVRQFNNFLIYPLRNCNSDSIQQIEVIFPEKNAKGKQKFLYGSSTNELTGRRHGTFLLFGHQKLKEVEYIVLAESLTKACAIYQASEPEGSLYASVLACPSAANMGKVINDLCAMGFKDKLVVCADRDSGANNEHSINKLVFEALEKTGTRYFQPPKGSKDIDDFYASNNFAPDEIFILITESTALSVSEIDDFGFVAGSGDWDKPYQWLIEDWIPKAAIGFLGGPSTHGKTFVCIELMGLIAFGIEAFGELTVSKGNQGAVAYCSVEGLQGLAHRLEAYRQSRQIELSLWNSRIWQFTKAFTFINTPPDIFCRAMKYRECLTGEKLQAIFIDTFRSHGGVASENSSTDAQKAITWMRNVSSILKVSVIATHHTGKSSVDNKPRPGMDFNQLLRGSSDLGSSAEFIIGVVKGEVAEEDMPVPFIWSAKLKDTANHLLLPAPIINHELRLSNGSTELVGIIKKGDSDLTLVDGGTQQSKTDKAIIFLRDILSKNVQHTEKVAVLQEELKAYIRGKEPEIKAEALRKRLSRLFNNLPERYFVKKDDSVTLV